MSALGSYSNIFPVIFDVKRLHGYCLHFAIDMKWSMINSPCLLSFSPFSYFITNILPSPAFPFIYGPTLSAVTWDSFYIPADILGCHTDAFLLLLCDRPAFVEEESRHWSVQTISFFFSSCWPSGFFFFYPQQPASNCLTLASSTMLVCFQRHWPWQSPWESLKGKESEKIHSIDFRACSGMFFICFLGCFFF